MLKKIGVSGIYNIQADRFEHSDPQGKLLKPHFCTVTSNNCCIYEKTIFRPLVVGPSIPGNSNVPDPNFGGSSGQKNTGGGFVRFGGDPNSHPAKRVNKVDNSIFL